MSQRIHNVKYYAKNAAKEKSRCAAYHSKNVARIRERKAKYYAKDPDRVLVRHVKFAKENPAKIRAYAAGYRALKLAQRCDCCTDARLGEIYGFALRNLAEVDHRVPLRLGGHHCLRNLQTLSVEVHLEKTKRDLRSIAESRRRSKLLRNWRTT
jgi:5-methylcytosine-specific restriction endonuclease McrA